MELIVGEKIIVFQIAEACGFQLNVDTAKELAKSLDEIEAKSSSAADAKGNKNPSVGRMMRMMLRLLF